MLLLLFWSIYLFLNVDVSPIVMGRWNEEIASLFTLLWSNVAVGCELVVATWELVLWIFVDVKFLVLLGGLKLIALKKHFYLKT